MTTIETKSDFVECLTHCGWLAARDEVGETRVEIRFGHLIIVGLVDRRDTRYAENPTGTLIMGLSAWATDEAVNIAYTSICNPRKRISDHCIIYQTDEFAVSSLIITTQQVVNLSEKTISWAKSCNISEGLKALRNLPTNSIGAMPARHLAALAGAGDVETLSRYRDSFVAGDRLGFVPYITNDFIARALDFAAHRQAEPGWLPNKPKMRV